MAVSSIFDNVAVLSTYHLVGVATLIVLSIFVGSEYRAYKRLAHVPGPKWMGWTNLSMAKKQLGGRIHHDLLEMKNKYGKLIRVGPNQVVTSDPNAMRHMAGARSSWTRGRYFDLVKIDPNHHNIFSQRDESIHKALKNKMGPGYSGKENGGFEPGIDKHVASFVDLIRTRYLSTSTDFRPMDLAIKCNYFALDVISEVGFGEPFGFLKEDKDLYEYNKTSRKFFAYAIAVANVPCLLGLMHKWPLKTLGPNKYDKSGFGRLMEFATHFVDKRLLPNAKPGRDMMQSFINAGLTREELMQEVWVETAAGSDTTATAVRSAFLCLLRNPAALAKMQRAIDDGVAAGEISSPIKNAQAREMPYLQAVIRETLRLWPPATGLLSKEVPPGGDELCGYSLPGGTQVGNNTFAMLRDKGMFGPDADMFRPERWIEAESNPERVKEMVGAVELIFGYGKYMCLGKTIAFMELNKIIIELLRRFDFALVKPEEPVKLFGAAIIIIEDFWVRVSEREKAA